MPGTTPTPIATPIVFPFEPDGASPIEETVEFRTDILASHNDSEDRIAVRRKPVTKMKWLVTGMSDGEAGLLAGMLYRQVANRWYIPLWQHARAATAVAASAYSIDMTDAHIDFSGKVLVWKDPFTWDLMDYVLSDATSVTLAGATSFAHTPGVILVVPLAVGALDPTSTIQRINNVSIFNANFEIEPVNNSAVTPLAPAVTYKGVEVLSILPDIDSSSSIDEKAVLTSERVGGSGGRFYMRPYATSPVYSRKIGWIFSDRASRANFRQWLYQRRGRKSPFWSPTFQDDFKLVTAAANGAGSIDIAYVNFGNLYFGATGRVHIALLLPSGVILPRTVTNATVPQAGVERLFLDATLTAAAPLGTRISLLVYVRLSEDAIVMNHVTRDITLVNTSFTELPRETPA